MKDDYGWVPPVFFISIFFVFFIGLLSWMNGNETGITDGRNQGIIYCMEKPEKCKIEYQYLKLQNSK